MGRVFYIIEPDPVVGLDLAGALRDWFDGARIERLQTVAAMLDAPVGADAVCLVNPSAVPPQDLDVLALWQARGAGLVFIGAPAPGYEAAWVLDQPFTTDMIVEAVNAASAAPVTPPAPRT